MTKTLLPLALLTFGINSHAQIILKADGKTDTFELISNAFAPNYKPIESPGFKKGTCNNHSDFQQKHITQV